METYTEEGSTVLLYKLPLKAAQLKYPVTTLNQIFSRPDFYTVFQFTEMFDKNGKEIYDGDIIKYDDGNVCNGKYGEVCFTMGSWAILDNEGSLDSDLFYRYHKLIVVGNRFENPELLEEY
jgi:uncharacterized phage protein (TIGR01671 family)